VSRARAVVSSLTHRKAKKTAKPSCQSVMDNKPDYYASFMMGWEKKDTCVVDKYVASAVT
jgi:hypothetical protein